MPAQVRYLYQADRSLIGCMPVWHDAAYMEQQLRAQFGMLLGETPPAKVAVCDDWKCTYCVFYHACGGPQRQNDTSQKVELPACQPAA